MFVIENDPSLVPPLARTEYGTIVVVGGGCYGTYYVRQLLRARSAGAVRWERLLVVDRDENCAVARAAHQWSGDVELERADWRDFFGAYLGAAAAGATGESDAIVPSPLMPHLMYDWILSRARERWPDRRVESRPLAVAPKVPWERAGEGGTHYVSFADWMCPVNCIEPRKCPHTRSDRHWSLPRTLRAHVAAANSAGGALTGPIVFHCTHRAYGVGMLDTFDVVEADRMVAIIGSGGAAEIVVGTVSHCHGALNVLAIGKWPEGPIPSADATGGQRDLPPR